MNTLASAPRLYLIKSDVKIAHQAGYALYGGRWHKVHQNKPAPKGAPLSSHPQAAGQHAPVKHFTDEQWEGLKLPSENANAGTFNKQLKQLQEWSDAGDVTAIVGAGFGTNTYGKKLALIANNLLGLHGSPHKVAAGQKPGWHAAVEHTPAAPSAAPEPDPVAEAPPAPAAPEPAAAAPASAIPSPPEFGATYKTTPFYTKAAAHLKNLADAGDLAALEEADDGSAAYQGKSPNSKMLMAYHAALLEAVVQAGPPPAVVGTAPEPVAAPAPAAPEIPKLSQTTKTTIDTLASDGKWDNLQALADASGSHPALVAYINEALKNKPVAASQPAPAAPTSPVATMPWDKFLLPAENTNAGSYNKKVAQIKALAEAGDVAGLKALTFGVNTYGKKGKLIAQAAIDAIEQGFPATAPAPAPASSKQSAIDDLVAAKVANEVFTAAMSATWNALSVAEQDDVINLVIEKQKQVPAKPAVIGLNASDLPSMMIAVKPDVAAKAKQLAAEGKAVALKKLHDTQSEFSSPNTKVYVGAVLAALEAKQNNKISDTGPKEGDTKPGANGYTLVFKNGRWHAQPKAEHPIDAVPAPDLSGWGPTQQAKVESCLKELQHQIKSGDLSGLKGITKKMASGKLIIALPNVNAPGKIKVTGTLAGKAGPIYQYAEALKVAAGKAPKAKAAPAPAPAPAAPAAKPAPAYPSMDDWQQTGPQGGSNPGGKFKAPDGTEYYCKFPENEDIAKSEVLAAKLYAAAGLAGQDAQLVTKGGKVGIASKWVDVKKGKTTAALAKAPDAQGGFAVDAWLGNWDVVGLGYDNLQIGADGKAVRVDAGGSLEYRAQGSKKPFGNHVDEIDTLRDSVKNPQAAAIFGKMTQADIAASVAKVAAVSDSDIWNLVQKFGPGSYDDKKAMAATLIARKADLLAKYPKAALAVAKGSSWVRLAPGERVVEAGEKFGVHWAKIKVPAKGFRASSIATPPNFFTNGNQGPTSTWKSSVQHVNEANNLAGQRVYDTAIEQKNFAAVQGLTFEQIDKASGQKTGVKLPYAQHPAGEIKEYYKQVTAELEAQTQATYKTVQNGSFTQSYSTAALSMASDFTPVDYAGFKNHAAKAADYLVLNKSAAAGLPVPDEGAFEEQWENLSPKLIEFKKACSAKYQGLSSAEQTACKAYTGSSYANWNQALRSGDTKSNAYQSAQAMVKGFEKAAMDIPEGTILWRGIGVGEDTYKAVTGAVIQDGSFQSSSFGSSPAFSGHKTWLKIHVGKGVKGLHATSFSNFGSSEREIIIKNNVRYAVLNVTHHKNFVDSKGQSHGAKTIVDLLALPHEG